MARLDNLSQRLERANVALQPLQVQSNGTSKRERDLTATGIATTVSHQQSPRPVFETSSTIDAEDDVRNMSMVH